MVAVLPRRAPSSSCAAISSQNPDRNSISPLCYWFFFSAAYVTINNISVSQVTGHTLGLKLWFSFPQQLRQLKLLRDTSYPVLWFDSLIQTRRQNKEAWSKLIPIISRSKAGPLLWASMAQVQRRTTRLFSQNSPYLSQKKKKNSPELSSPPPPCPGSRGASAGSRGGRSPGKPSPASSSSRRPSAPSTSSTPTSAPSRWYCTSPASPLPLSLSLLCSGLIPTRVLWGSWRRRRWWARACCRRWTWRGTWWRWTWWARGSGGWRAATPCSSSRRRTRARRSSSASSGWRATPSRSSSTPATATPPRPSWWVAWVNLVLGSSVSVSIS